MKHCLWCPLAPHDGDNWDSKPLGCEKMGVGSTLKAKYSRLYNVTSRYHFLAATPAIDQEVDTIGILCKSSLWFGLRQFTWYPGSAFLAHT
jgi:hypothetical protein